MDEIILKVKFPEEFTESLDNSITKWYVLSIICVVGLYIYLFIQLYNVYIIKINQDKLMEYYGRF